MSARLEVLHERLRVIKEQIAGGDASEALLEQEREVVQQLTKARELLTENASKVLRG